MIATREELVRLILAGAIKQGLVLAQQEGLKDFDPMEYSAGDLTECANLVTQYLEEREMASGEYPGWDG